MKDALFISMIISLSLGVACLLIILFLQRIVRFFTLSNWLFPHNARRFFAFSGLTLFIVSIILATVQWSRSLALLIIYCVITLILSLNVNNKPKDEKDVGLIIGLRILWIISMITTAVIGAMHFNWI